jgi:hypothetical protein
VPRIPELNLVAGPENRLVDSRPVDHGAAGGAEIDEPRLPAIVDLDDRMHAGHGFLLQAQVRGRQLADLDDRLAQHLLSHHLLAFEDLELDGYTCVGHG